MENERLQEVLDLVIEYGQTKHNRKKKELLQKIENLLTQQKTEQKTIEEVIDHTKTYGKCFDKESE